MLRHWPRVLLFLGAVLAPTGFALAVEPISRPERYELVIDGARVIDPASGLDAVRNVGIRAGSIRAVSEERLEAPARFDATGMIVAPGFIDLHSHGQNEENYRFKAMDGVTTALELEVGTPDVDQWYTEREGKSLINFGISAGHIGARMRVLGGPGTWLPEPGAAQNEATDSQVNQIKHLVEAGLERGAVAVGLGIQYTPGVSRWEILEIFRLAAKFDAACHVHIRHVGEKEPNSALAALEEVVAAATITGAPLHVVHVSSMGLRSTGRLLQAIAEAQSRGLDITTECYPYTASMSPIKSAIFAEGWQEMLGVSYGDLQWVATGERLTAESFARYREAGGYVIIHSMPELMVRDTVASPLTMIASDGLLDAGKGHPRSSGTYARVLGRYVREQQVLTLMEAIRKMTIMPAERLEHRVPSMKNKGRLQVGADADLVVFDPQTIVDQSTFEQPAKYSKGVRLVLVGGTSVVKDGKLQDAIAPGRAIRAPLP